MQMFGNWTFGTLVFTVLVFTVTLKVHHMFYLRVCMAVCMAVCTVHTVHVPV